MQASDLKFNESCMFYVCQPKGSEPGEFNVVRLIQCWEGGWPKDVSRDVIKTGLSREYADMLANEFDRSMGKSTVTDLVGRKIDFLCSDGNKVNAENPSIELIY